MLRRPASESRATTKGSSVVPGFAKQTSMPALMALATNASAPFIWRSHQTITSSQVCALIWKRVKALSVKRGEYSRE
jgi:hypothetical protein